MMPRERVQIERVDRALERVELTRAPRIPPSGGSGDFDMGSASATPNVPAASTTVTNVVTNLVTKALAAEPSANPGDGPQRNVKL